MIPTRRTAPTLATALVLCALAPHYSMAQRGNDGSAEQEIASENANELRRQLQVAEEAVYSRFNDINSDDRFDIHCRNVTILGSRVPKRQCTSRDFRAQDAALGEVTTQGLSGGTSGAAGTATPGGQFLAAQLEGQAELFREIQRLAATDEQLAQAVAVLGERQRALAQFESRANGSRTLSREMAPEEHGLADGHRAFEVRIGRDPWTHKLAEHTFTLTSVTGEIRNLNVECAANRTRLEYQQDIDWTLPASWQECSLIVDASRDTTFILVEAR